MKHTVSTNIKYRQICSYLKPERIGSYVEKKPLTSNYVIMSFTQFPYYLDDTDNMLENCYRRLSNCDVQQAASGKDMQAVNFAPTESSSS